MKKILLICGSIIVFWVCIWMFFFTPEKLTPENPAGKTMYYTKISGSGVQGENRRYDYEVIAYDEKKKQKELSFSAGKKLREGAYIQLYYTMLRGVTSWKEVSFKELPETVQQQYEK
ncbi:YxeA family protein [Bacillus tropicus]|uniref:YxeA family protein n=1 Tax=Bacillus cereus group TaxID=86661 RepID=UPI000CD8F080|nr:MULTISPECIES: YxeA family protein [Bacillus cereus group]MCC2337920.1 YxeA family protein [Bacillus tropicus]MCU5421209.1 YxeA family protein [Bacillus tropicus]